MDRTNRPSNGEARNESNLYCVAVENTNASFFFDLVVTSNMFVITIVEGQLV